MDEPAICKRRAVVTEVVTEDCRLADGSDAHFESRFTVQSANDRKAIPLEGLNSD